MTSTNPGALRELSIEELDLVAGGKDTNVKIGPIGVRISDGRFHAWIDGVGGVSVNTEQGIICGNVGGLGGCIW